MRHTSMLSRDQRERSLGYDLIIRPSANFISELSIAGSPLLADPPVQLITSPGLTVLCVQP